MEGPVKGKGFKMKGHTLPGINQRIDANPTNVAAEGLAGSSPLQKELGSSPLEYEKDPKEFEKRKEKEKKAIGPEMSKQQIDEIKEGKIDRLRMDYKSGKIADFPFREAKKEIRKYVDY